MIGALRRQVGIYGAFAAMVPKVFMAYRMWFWVGMILQVFWMVIFVSFWRAVYATATSETISGLTLQQTINYILLAQVLGNVGRQNFVSAFAQMLREGELAIALLRPLDFQGSYYVQSLTELITDVSLQSPMIILALLFFGLQLPTDPLVWITFAITMVLGHAVIFSFNWLVGCFAFYTTEAWGLSVLVFGVSLFFSGSLVPLDMMPDWLRTVTLAMPFAQALYVPVSVLSGIAPLNEVPRLWLTQLGWVVGLGLASRLFFSIAVRKITVQGG